MATSIYKNIQSFAKRNGMSIRQIEIALGYSNGTIRKWRDDAPVSKLSDVAGYIGVSVAQLIYTQQKEASK